jgi:hypothetical protein
MDEYGEAEQCVVFLAMLDDQLRCPFTTEIRGKRVRVERVELNDADEIVAICRSGRRRHAIPLLGFPLLSLPPVGWEWIEAYRHWVRGRQ